MYAYVVCERVVYVSTRVRARVHVLCVCVARVGVVYVRARAGVCVSMLFMLGGGLGCM